MHAFYGKKMIGNCEVRKCKVDTEKHVGELGILLVKYYRGMGLGKFMMRYMIKEAHQKLKLEIITLKVYSKNKPAIRLYRKLGFKVAGKIPKGIKYYGKYMDDIIMFKHLKNK